MTAYAKLSSLPLDQIAPSRSAVSLLTPKPARSRWRPSTATWPRYAACNLAVEWGKGTTILPRVRLLGGENLGTRALVRRGTEVSGGRHEHCHQLAEAYTRALRASAR
jgi:hypothetical protein